MNSNEMRDLIYLVIDGEANDVERSTLFSNLSFDSELQNEFQDALNLNRSVEFERKIASPPMALTTALFTKAGLSTDYFQNSQSVNKSAAVNSPLKRFFGNRFLQNTLFFATGVLATIIIVRSLFDNNLNTNNELISDRLQQNTQQSVSTNTDIDKNVNINKTDSDIPFINRKSNFPQHINTVEPQQYAESDPVFQNEKVTLSSLHDADTKDIIYPVNTDIKELKTDNSMENYQSSLLKPVNNDNVLTGVQLEATGLGAIAYQPSRESISAFPYKFDNFSASASLRIDSKSRFGIQGGIETYPIYVKVSDTLFSPINSLMFFGAFYQYNFDNYEFYGTLEPNIHIMLGGTKTGFLTKASIGFNWFPESILGISIGISNIGIVSSYKNELNYTNKIGFYYGMIYQF